MGTKITWWQLVCCAMAVPIVYAYDQVFFEAIGIVFVWAGELFGRSVQLLGPNPATWKPMPNYTSCGPHDSMAACVVSSVFVLTIGIFIVLPIVVFLSLVLIAGALIIGLAIGIPLMIISWLIQNPGPLRYVADVGLVWFVGMFIYGIAFPLLWMVLAPLLAMTLGEMTYQDLRSQLYGERARYLQPLYLLIGVVGTTGGSSIFLRPTVQAGAAVASTAWHDNVSSVFFTPIPPTPSPWPYRFTVPAHTTIPTGIKIIGPDYALPLATQEHVFAGLDTPNSIRWFVKQTDSDVDRNCVAPLDRVCNVHWLHYGRIGEVMLTAADMPAKVVIYEPQPTSDYWLLPGRTVRLPTWLDRGASLSWSGDDKSLQYRVTRAGYASRWRALEQSPLELPEAGYVEVSSNKYLQQFSFGTFKQTEQTVRIPAKAVIDTKITVKSGDRFRISSWDEPIYAGAENLELLPRRHYMERTANKAGTIRLKGGLLDSGADVKILARGEEWK